MKIFGTAKLKRIATLASTVAFLPLGSVIASATPVPSVLQTDSGLYQSSDFQQVDWDDAKRKKLRHAFWLLNESDRDYDGHKAKAIEEIKEAGRIMGIDLKKGEGWGGEHQKWSDARLREARDLLIEVAEKSGGPREHEHLRKSIHEIDKALEVR